MELLARSKALYLLSFLRVSVALSELRKPSGISKCAHVVVQTGQRPISDLGLLHLCVSLLIYAKDRRNCHVQIMFLA